MGIETCFPRVVIYRDAAPTWGGASSQDFFLVLWKSESEFREVWGLSLRGTLAITSSSLLDLGWDLWRVLPLFPLLSFLQLPRTLEPGSLCSRQALTWPRKSPGAT